MADRIDSLRLFARAARTRSFSRTGRDFGLTQPVVSRNIAALERSLGTALFTRTTRAVALTDAGKEFLARIEPLLDQLDEAYQTARGSGEIRGVLRIGMSSSFGIREVIPRLPAFMQAYPHLKLEFLMNDQRQDLVLEGVDVAIRLGELPDSSARARRLTTIRRIIVAAPEYLGRMGVPQHPKDLADHTMIAGPGGIGPTWTFRHGAEVASVRLECRIKSTLNEGAIAAAVAGLGITITGVPSELPELTAGSLAQVLLDWELDRMDVHAVFAAGKSAKPAARAFADFLARHSRTEV